MPDVNVANVASEFQPNGRRLYTFDIPTEMVIWKPGIYTPRQGRFWAGDLYCCGAIYLPMEQLQKRPMLDVNGYDLPQAYCVERWKDDGGDGHTEYRLVGYDSVTNRDEAEHWHEFQYADCQHVDERLSGEQKAHRRAYEQEFAQHKTSTINIAV